MDERTRAITEGVKLLRASRNNTLRRACAERLLKVYGATGEPFCRGDAIRTCQDVAVCRRSIRRAMLDLVDLGLAEPVVCSKKVQGKGGHYRVMAGMSMAANMPSGSPSVGNTATAAPTEVEPMEPAQPVMPQIEANTPPTDLGSADERVSLDMTDDGWEMVDAAFDDEGPDPALDFEDVEAFDESTAWVDI